MSKEHGHLVTFTFFCCSYDDFNHNNNGYRHAFVDNDTHVFLFRMQEQINGAMSSSYFIQSSFHDDGIDD